MNPLEASIQDAVHANAELARLFARIGTTEHPNGAVMVAYRNARRAVQAALKAGDSRGALEVISQLGATLRNEAGVALTASQALGLSNATAQLANYSVGAPVRALALLEAPRANAVVAVNAVINAQVQTVNSMIATGAEEGLIIGDAARMGALAPGGILKTLTRWVATNTWQTWELAVTGSDLAKKDEFSKQAIAALDERTTDCCLQVHGQIVPFSANFILTGEPRYADELDWPPFHWWCRSSAALYSPIFDDGLTERMQAGAKQVLKERAAGQNIVRHPADAYG